MRRAVAVIGLSLVLLGSSVAPARASCVAPRPFPREIEDAPAVFVGTVVDAENENRWAMVEVSDVWKGEVDDRVEVRAGPKDPPGPMSTITSVDRSYKEGTAYLFVPFRGSGDLFRDNICTRTTVYKPSLDRFRPASAETAPGPTEGLPPDEDASAWVFAGVGVVAVALAVLVARAMKGRNRSESPD